MSDDLICSDCGAELPDGTSSCPNCDRIRQTRLIAVSDALSLNDSVIVELWIAASFAREWHDDALREARSSVDRCARRREIIYAICLAETYLFEWVRDDVLKRDYRRLAEYFPPDLQRGVCEKWKEIPKRLKADKLIADTQRLDGAVWQDFRLLVDYRDGLIHARASRPDTSGLDEDARPKPKPEDLDTMEPGWGLRVVAMLIRELHGAAGGTSPGWLVDP